MTADEFHAARDQRTLACAGAARFHDAKVVLSIDDLEAQTASGQATFLIAANLMSRWARRARIDVPRIALRPEVGSLAIAPRDGLAETTLELMRWADPFGDFEAGTWRDAIRVHVGAGGTSDAHCIRGDGWLALAGTPARDRSGRQHDTVGLGAALAACVGVAIAFRRAIGDPVIPSDVRLSLWNLRGGASAEQGPPPVQIKVGRLLIAGFGAVGSSYAYLLAPGRPIGEIVIVDGDVIDASNLNRSPIFGAPQLGLQKALVGEQFFLERGVLARAVSSWLDDAIRSGELGARFDLVVPVANERAARLVVQQQVPPLQIYGTTSRDWQAFLGRHLPLVEDCLICRFPERAAKGTPAMVCSTGAVGQFDATGAPHADAALPFLSVASAALAIAETQKAMLDVYPVQPNFACLDFRGPLLDFLTQQLSPVNACICGGQSHVWQRLNGTSAFARHSSHAGEWAALAP